MKVKMEQSPEPPRKQTYKGKDNYDACSEKQTVNGELVVSDFSDIEVLRIVSSGESNCSVAVEAKFKNKEGRMLVHLQKTPFEAKTLEGLLQSSSLTQLFHNDVYSKHTALSPPELNKIQATVIYPAEDKHFARYERQSSTLVTETPETYETVTKPFIYSGSPLNKQWIYNILDGVSEADRVICRDDDPELGFVLVPDLKWTGEQLTDLYCQALVMRRDISSVRELSEQHLPLLKNIRQKSLKAIEVKYGVSCERLRAYFHYLPSFYHLHVHFAALTFDAPGTWCGKAHLLNDVISNLEICGDYYKKATLSFTVRDNHPHPLARDKRMLVEAESSKCAEPHGQKRTLEK